MNEESIELVEPDSVNIYSDDLFLPFGNEDRNLSTGLTEDYDITLGFSERQLKALYRTARETEGQK